MTNILPRRDYPQLFQHLKSGAREKAAAAAAAAAPDASPPLFSTLSTLNSRRYSAVQYSAVQYSTVHQQIMKIYCTSQYKAL